MCEGGCLFVPKRGSCPQGSGQTTGFSGATCTNDFDPQCSLSQKCCPSFNGGLMCMEPQNSFIRPINPSIAGNQNQNCQNRPYEVYQQFGPGCEDTCNDLQGRSSFCTQPSRAGCFCTPGYVRQYDNGPCVSTSSCIGNSIGGFGGGDSNCGANEEYDTCRRCEETCDDRRSGRIPVCGSTCQPGCVCRPGYVRQRVGGACVLAATCQQNNGFTGGGGTENCFGNLVFSQCNANPACQRSCDNLNGVIACPASCTPGCVCRQGFVRLTRYSSECVTLQDCQSSGTGNVIGSGAETVRRATAVFRGTVNGEVFFTQQNQGQPMQITGTLQGLNPNGQHAMHVHTLGDLTSGCSSAGDHFDPYNQQHGGRDSSVRHVGDFGNVNADSAGRATINFSDRIASLNGPNSIIGRALVIHNGVDDLGLGGTAASQSNGNSGDRRACAVVGIQEAYRFRAKAKKSASIDEQPIDDHNGDGEATREDPNRLKP